jgi:hypothetical protein
MYLLMLPNIALGLEVSLLEKCQHVKVVQTSQYVHQVQQEDLTQGLN